jgi:probable phosphoglycerate mutase
MTTVVTLRHGETAWNREGRMQGWAPVPLNDRGREQATAAGEWLADEYAFDAVYSSDLERTRETTERVLAAFDDPPTPSYERAWRERDVGVYQGLTYGAMEERYPTFALGETAAESAEAVPDGGESLAAVSERVTARFRELCASYGDDETLLVVSHGGPIYMLTGYAKGIPIRDAVLDHSQDNCGATVFAHDGGETQVVAENATAWG